MTVSARTGAGLNTAWDRIRALVQARRDSGHWALTRLEQSRHWFAEEVRQGLLAALTREPVRGFMADLGDRVARGALTPEAAAAEVLRVLGR